MKKTYNIKGVLEIVSDDEYYYFIQTSRVCRYNKAFKKDNFIKIKNPCYVVSDVSLNLVVVVNTESIVNMYSYDNLELLATYSLDYSYRDCIFDNKTHTLYISTYNSNIYTNKLFSINLLSKEIKSKSMTFGYIYGFIEVNTEKLFLKEIKVDPNDSTGMIVEVNNKFDIINKIQYTNSHMDDFLNINLVYDCFKIYDISNNTLHILRDIGINEKILYIKYIKDKYFLWSIWNMHILDSNFNYIKTFKSEIQFLNVHMADDKFIISLDDYIECYDSIEEYLLSE